MTTHWITAIIDGVIVIFAAFLIFMALQWKRRHAAKSAQTHSLLHAKQLMAQGRYAEALTQLNALASTLGRHPKNAVDIHLCQGICLREIGIFQREPDSLRAAIPQLEKAYKLCANKKPIVAAKVLYELSRCYLALADFESKEIFLAKAIAASKEAIAQISAKAAPTL